MRFPRMKSRVRVELEVRTREERVDMEAESTRITTTAMRRVGRPESMAGITASKPSAAMSTRSPKSRPKPPRK